MKKNKQIWYSPMVIALCFLFLAASCAGPATQKKRLNTELRGLTEKNDIASQDMSYILGISDVISINVWKHGDLDRELTIDLYGHIYYPLVGKIKADGMGILELQEVISSGLSNYIYKPQVDIKIDSIGSRKLYVLGEVNNPGLIRIDRSISALEAVATVGGFTLDANKRNVVLIRKDFNKIHIAAFDLKSVLMEGKIKQNVALQNGDILYIPPSAIASIERFMNRFYNIINPIVAIEQGIILGPSVVDVFRGKETHTTIISQ